MLFLDACRDVPVGSKSGTKGLGQISVIPKGTLVVYATEVGKVAKDSTLFINELTKTILKPNKKVWEIGNHLSNAIASKTNDRQIPEMFSKRLPSGLVLLRGEKKEEESDEVVVNSTSQWITLTNSICKANGGEFDNGACNATWKTAKKICRASGARLATIDELKQVVVDCGGSLTTTYEDKNKADKFYQSCYKKKGFSSTNSYWSSTTDVNSDNTAWFVDFYYGTQYSFFKVSRYYVRCVRAGQ